MTTISILGSGWLGLPLAQRLRQSGYLVKASTRSPDRIEEITAVGAEAALFDIESLSKATDDFLNADILVINITSKNVDAFRILVEKVSASSIKNLLFVSSTSV